MTEPVKGISGSQPTHAGGNYSGGGLAGDHKKRGSLAQQADLIEISRDARSQSVGKKRKNILEYLKELFG